MEDLQVTVIQSTGWNRVLNAARATVGKEPIEKEPSDAFKHKVLSAEHSPIRLLEFDITINNAPNEVVGHLVRHHIGVEKFVATLRKDRSGVDPSEVTYITPRNVMLSCNAQALISISRKRLCGKASAETRATWNEVKSAIAKVDTAMALHMVPECIYRGFCPEVDSCGFTKTNIYKMQLSMYQKVLNHYGKS